MSRVDELIAELCPKGVPYRRVDDICDITRGRVISKDYIRDNKGEYPVYSSQTENYGELGRIKTYDFEGEYLTWTTDGANAGSVFYRNGKFSITNVCGLLKITENEVMPKYLYYVLQIQAPKYVVKGMGNPKLMSNVMAKIKIQVPPLQVQREIVRILDDFTELTVDLIAKLKEELTIRKKQYEYYRDELILNAKDAEIISLENIATDIYRGVGIKREQVTDEGISCVRYGEIYTTYELSFNECKSHTTEDVVASPKYFEYGDLLFAITGESVEDIAKSIVYLGNEKCLAGGDIVVLKHKQEPRYMAYALSTRDAQKQKSKGKVKNKVVHSNVPSIKKIKIPIPPIEEQKRIADLLDEFHYLFNDIINKIPAEIEARQKQYEYYRNKLLLFKELDV